MNMLNMKRAHVPRPERKVSCVPKVGGAVSTEIQRVAEQRRRNLASISRWYAKLTALSHNPNKVFPIELERV